MQHDQQYRKYSMTAEFRQQTSHSKAKIVTRIYIQSMLNGNKDVMQPAGSVVSSATTRSNTTLTICRMVAAAVLVVVLSFAKCSRKHSTNA